MKLAVPRLIQVAAHKPGCCFLVPLARPCLPILRNKLLTPRKTVKFYVTGRMPKKIIVGCDGTWLDSDGGYQAARGQKTTPSNVTRLCRALLPETKDNVSQIVNYEPGIGSANNWWDHFINGATAMSIGANVDGAYRAIADKYCPGDEIYLFGFSRGAFIARSVCTMIADLGLLNNRGMEFFFDIFQDWENQNIPHWKQRRYPNKTFKDQNDGAYSSYTQQLDADKLTRLDIRVKVLGVWDTVGSLGVPTIGWRRPTRTYAFVNTEPSWNVDYCFQALALDEHRNPFGPTLWELPDNRIPGQATKHPCDLRQCWFPGVHSNIGGSVADAELPDVTLAWMVAQVEPFLEFDREYLKYCHQVNVDFYKQSKVPERRWGMGRINNPMTGIQVLGGSSARTPGGYYRTDPVTGRQDKQKLKNTNERIHPSVRIRRFNNMHGKGVDDVGTYIPPALKGFTLKHANGSTSKTEYDPLHPGYVWERQDPHTGETISLPEETLAEVERDLLTHQGLAPM